MLPIALIGKIFIHDFWLVGEEQNEARDNGYWFFKYVREQHPKQKIAYAINKKCSDYGNVKDLGKVIQWGSLSHWFWYLVAKKNISSQKGCKPNAAACYLFENKIRIWRNKRYFLQHGVIINNLEWLYYDKCYFKLFCVSAKPEYEYVSSTFGYPKGIIENVGLCRFDRLYEVRTVKNSILVMPTWRGYLVRPHGSVSKKDLANTFTTSEYFLKWSELLTSEELGKMLVQSGCKLLFYPHRNMQIYLDKFKGLHLADNIEIADPDILTVQQALKNAECLITDYSSIFADFAYMKKPIIFYQFDEKEFRENQYSEGYFDYHDNPLGEWCGNFEDCLSLLRNNIEKHFPINENVKDFFEYYDNKNCERTYLAVKSR